MTFSFIEQMQAEASAYERAGLGSDSTGAGAVTALWDPTQTMRDVRLFSVEDGRWYVRLGEARRVLIERDPAPGETTTSVLKRCRSGALTVGDRVGLEMIDELVRSEAWAEGRAARDLLGWLRLVDEGQAGVTYECETCGIISPRPIPDHECEPDPQR